MDIIKPDIYDCNGRFYCLFSATGNTPSQSRAPYCEDDGDFDASESHEHDDEEFDIFKQDDLYKCRFNVPLALFKFIIGTKGQTIKQIQRDTGATIKTDSSTEDQTKAKLDKEAYLEGTVTVSSTERQNTVRATSRIHLILHEKRHTVPSSHYLCIPLASDVIEEYKGEFKARALSLLNQEDANNAQMIKFSHVTLAMATVLSKRDLTMVTKIVNDSMDSLNLRHTSHWVTLEDLEIMGNDDTSDVRVLYMKTKNICWAKDLALEVQSRLSEAGIPTDKRDQFKPHMTLFNQIGNESIDASKIFQELGKTSFGEHEIKELRLVSRATREMTSFEF